jgi:hypothetical protein
MPHGRYSPTKKTLHNGVVARPALALSPEQDALLTEMATLVYYHPSGFTYTKPMMKLVKSIAAGQRPPRNMPAWRPARAEGFRRGP